jgi:type VI secretion system protein ImpC
MARGSYAPPVSSDEKEEGGIILGGVSFGVGPEKGAPDKEVPNGKTPPDGTPAIAGEVGGVAVGTAPSDLAPGELGDALLPLRAIAVTDLVPRGEFNAGPNAPEQAVRVEVGAFDELFKRLKPRLAIEVESVLAAGGMVRVDFSPNGMKSFRPDHLVRDVPLLHSLMDGRAVLERLRDGSMSVEAVAEELARVWQGSPFVAKVLGGVELKQAPAPAAAAAAPAASDGDVARILDMVDTGSDSSSASPPPPTAAAPSGAKKGRFDAFISAVAKSGSSKPGANPSQAIATLEKAISLQLGAIVQHAEYRRLEEAWRGLEFFVSRSPKEAVRLEVVSARPDDMVEALSRAINANAGIEPPVSFAVVDACADGDAASFARLRAIADLAELETVPIITNAGAGLLGHPHLGDIDRLDNKQGLYDAPERAPWRSEANRPAMLWVALAMNRVLARTAYDKRTSRIREASVTELPGEQNGTVWMQPCWTAGSLVTQSFGKTTWPHRITGARDGGTVENLPVHEVAIGYEGAEQVAIPTEAFFSTETQRALGRLGILAMASQPNSDEVYLLSAATAYVPPPKRGHDYDSAEDQIRLPQAPLGDQLFIARVVQFLRALGSKLGADNAPDDVQKVIEGALWELFANAAPSGPEINVAVERGDHGLSASVTLRPRRFLGVQMEEITLGVPLA